MFCGQASSEKLRSLWQGHKSQWLIKGVKSPAIRKLFIFVKVIVSLNLTDQKEGLLFFFSKQHIINSPWNALRNAGLSISLNKCEPPTLNLYYLVFSEVFLRIQQQPMIAPSISFVYRVVTSPLIAQPSYHMDLAGLQDMSSETQKRRQQNILS